MKCPYCNESEWFSFDSVNEVFNCSQCGKTFIIKEFKEVK